MTTAGYFGIRHVGLWGLVLGFLHELCALCFVLGTLPNGTAPFCGQTKNKAQSTKDKIKDQPVKDSLTLDSVHRVEQVFSLRIYLNPELLTLAAQSILELGNTLPGARSISNDYHRELALHHRLVNVNNATTRFGKYLGHTGNNPRMIQTKY